MHCGRSFLADPYSSWKDLAVMYICISFFQLIPLQFYLVPDLERGNAGSGSTQGGEMILGNSREICVSTICWMKLLMNCRPSGIKSSNSLLFKSLHAKLLVWLQGNGGVSPSFFAEDGAPLGKKSSQTVPSFVEQDRSRARVITPATYSKATYYQ